MMKMSGLLVLMSAFAPTAALAQDMDTILILGLASEERHRRDAELLTDRLREEAGRVPGWEVSPERTNIREAAAAAAATTGRTDCSWNDPDEVCIVAIAQAAGVRHVLYGSIRARAAMDRQRLYEVSLAHFDTATGRFAGDSYRTVRIDVSAGELTARVQTLLDDAGIRPRMDEPETVEPQVPSTDAQPASSGLSTRDLLTGFGIGSFVLAAGSLIGSIAMWASIDGMNGDADVQAYRSRLPAGLDLCAEASADRGWARGQVTEETAAAQAARARSVCSDAGSAEVMQWVFLAATAAFGGLGIAFLAIDTGPGQQPVTLTPILGPGRAGLMATHRF